MTDLTNAHLDKLAREAAESVAGPAAVEEVEVRRGNDVDERPAYHFTFLIDHSRAVMRPGLVRIRLMQRLADMLDEQGDDHRPVITILDRRDWERRTHAAFG